MKNTFFYLLSFILLFGCGANRSLLTVDNVPIEVSLDLINVIDDKVNVSIDPGVFQTEVVTFKIPKTVPGTYSTDDYGQYIEDLVAFDYNGNVLKVSRPDKNTWVIANGKNLDRLTYKVNDTYDTEREVTEAVFSPAGTNILAGENFMLNLHGFIGYFDGFKEVPYQLEISKPENLESTTSLTLIESKELNPNTDSYYASRYFEVIDNPILYAEPNKEKFQINDITVTLSVYSPNGAYKASDLKERTEKMMAAQKAFLGDIDGTKEYSILLYLSTMEDTDANGFGALEHHTSTVVVFPEAIPKERLEQAIVDVVSHEFFHIVTPLTVHSKEIQFFDFNDPKMSQHLWMYEGTTEYFANLFQINQGLISEEGFYERIMGKINNSKAYDDSMSFTVMSSNILNEPYKSNYANVYEKGALINMCLDILLRTKSNGQKGVLWLMKELSKNYGKDVPFEDTKLIDEIVALTYPEVRNFFDTHVIGEVPIDYSEYLAKVGLATVRENKQTGYFLDGEIPFIDVDQENGNTIYVREGIELSSFYDRLGIQGGDVIKSINGTSVDLESIRQIIGQSFGWNAETEIKMELLRGGESIVVEGPVGIPTMEVEKIIPVEGVSEDFAELRNAWLRG
jgi:predicted metalloprotease with PDZ domain